MAEIVGAVGGIDGLGEYVESNYKAPSLDVLITGSSRPQLWPIFWESYKQMCIIRTPHKISVHEDFVYPDQSKKVLNYLNGLGQSVSSHNPPIGLGPAMNDYIMNFDSKYMFYLQEDWFFERPIDIDHILWVMDNNPKINLIFFNKQVNNKIINNQEQREYEYSGMKICLYHGWTFLPGIWRMDFVKEKWQTRWERPEGYFTNKAFGSHDTRTSVEYCEDNIGAYMYGKQGEHCYVRHIGNDWRMAAWQLKGGQPGGVHNSEQMDKRFMPPWCIPHYKDGPTSRGDVSKGVN